jgi:multiple antibiotic resistance protein
MLWFIAITLASVVSSIILLFSNPLRRLLKAKGLSAMERLMGMLLTVMAVQMFLNGLGKTVKTMLTG